MAAPSTPPSTRPLPQLMIEGCWLAAAALVPAALAPDDSMLGFAQVPKVFVVRSVACVMLVLLAFEWLRLAPPTGIGRPWLRLFRGSWVLGHLGMLAALAVLLANLAALLLTPIKSVGFWGVDAGSDGYGVVSVLSYLILFVGVAGHLRTRAQYERLIYVLGVTASVIGLYGVGQHFGIDWFRSNPQPAQRAILTFGNPVFAGAWLLMPIPATLALWQTHRRDWTTRAHTLVGAALITLPIAGISVTVSRGSIVSLVIALVALLVAVAWMRGFGEASRPAASIAIAVAAVVALNVLPVDAPPTETPAIVHRFEITSLRSTESLNGRFEIWQGAIDSFFHFRWVDTDGFADLPDLRYRFLRPLVGYGPDTYRYAYLLNEAPPLPSNPFIDAVPEHGHNFAIHTLLELGLLGLLAYTTLAVAVGSAVLQLLLRARRGEVPAWVGFAAIGLGSAFVGRMIEQTAGKAQVADLALSWMLAGAVVALVSIRKIPPDSVGDSAAPCTARAGESGHGKLPKKTHIRTLFSGMAGLFVLVIWIQFVWSNAVAMVTVVEAQVAMDEGNQEEAFRLLGRAVEQAPGSTIVRLAYADALLQGVSGEQDIARQKKLLSRADRQARAVIDRNPLEWRAWFAAGNVAVNLAHLDSFRSSQAISVNQTAVKLMPSRWEARLQLAWAHMQLGNYEQALDVNETARALRATEGAQAGLFYFVEVASLRALGRTAEAQVAMDLLANLPSAAQGGYLQRLAEPSGG